MSRRTARGVASLVIARIAVVSAGIGIGIAVARVESPEIVGKLTAALVTSVVVESILTVGLSRFVIQATDRNQATYDTCFVGDITTAILGMLVLLGVSELFFDAGMTQQMVRALCVLPLLTGLTASFKNYAWAEEKFSTVAAAEIAGALLSAAIAIGALFAGLGVWAVVIREISRRVVIFMMLALTAGVRLALRLDKTWFKRAFNYSAPLYLVELTLNLGSYLDELLIAGRYTSAQLGLYNRGKTLAINPLRQLVYVAQQVMLPRLSKSESDELAGKAYIDATSLLALLAFPILGGLWIFAEDFIVAILGPSWTESVIYIQVLAIGLFWQIPSELLRPAFKARGKSAYELRTVLIMRGCMAIGVGIGAMFSEIGIAVGVVLGSLVGSFGEQYFAIRFFRYRLSNFFHGPAHAFIGTALATGLTWSIIPLGGNWASLGLGVPFFAVCYTCIMWFTRSRALRDFIKMLQRR